MPVHKVTDPKKIVTDPLVLKRLAEQGVDKDYVEFFQDYAPRSLGKEHSPYAKFYRDLKSNKRFMVVSGLPMVNADGVKVEVGWERVGNTYLTKPNQFSATVTGKRVTLNCVNDQPWGAKKGERVSWQPQLFLNDVEQTPVSSEATLLEVDPINENYHQNVLEWDYHICKRRLRIIEGRILGSWVFASKPSGEVRIKYNQTGDYRLKLGQFKVSDDEELITSEQLDEVAKLTGYPVTISDSATFYPDADPETSSLDGYVQRYIAAGTTWADIRDGAGTDFGDSATSIYLIDFYADDTTNYWRALIRAIVLFNTADLPDTAVITDAIFSLYGLGKLDELTGTPNLNVYSSNPASDTALAASDYGTLGATPFCDTAITYASYSTAGYNDFALNAAGKAAISRTGITKLGVRNANYDVANTPPPWISIKLSWMTAYSAEQGAGYKPKLVVTYIVLPAVNTDPATSVEARASTVNATLVTDGGEACDCCFEWGETVAYGNTTPIQSKGGY